MPETLPVSLNADRKHGVATAPSFETADSFVVRLESDGSPAHVHLHLDDALSTVATLETNNHYVEGVRDVAVTVEGGERPVKGTLEITTGYGANTERVAVTVVEPRLGTHYVDVDERLNHPPKRTAAESGGRSTPESGTLGLAALSVVALTLALGTAATLGSVPVALGAAVVVGSVVAALYFLFA